jgi:hypothetical protein
MRWIWLLMICTCMAQSTYIYRAPQCLSPRRNWDSPTPLAASECALPPGPKGGGAHSPAAKGVGESQFQRLEKRLALCLLCDVWPRIPFRHKTKHTCYQNPNPSRETVPSKLAKQMFFSFFLVLKIRLQSECLEQNVAGADEGGVL